MATTARTDILGVLRRNPGFRRLYIGQLVSFCGDWFAVVALQGLILDLTHAPALAGLMMTVQLLPTAIASPFAGVVVDRFDRRTVMIATDVARAALALGFLFAQTANTLWIAYMCAALMAVLAAFFDPASSAAFPNLVREEDLPTANMLAASAWGTMLAVGAGLGGLVTALLGRNAGFIGDAVSFLVSAALLATIRGRFHAEEPSREGGIRIVADIAEMIRFARADRRIGSLLIVKAGFGIAGGVMALISVMAKEVFHTGDSGIGWVMSGRGAGALFGPFVFRRFFGTEGRNLFRAIAIAFSVFGFGYALFGVSPTLWVAALGSFIAHLGGGAQWAFSTLGLQRFTPDHIRGRIFAADYSLISLTMGLSLLAAGTLADRFGPRPVALGLAALGVVWTILWTLLTRRTWPNSDGTPTTSKGDAWRTV